MVVNVDSSSTCTITNNGVAEVKVSLRGLNGKTAKVMTIDTDGPLIFGGHPMFIGGGSMISIRQITATAAATNVTVISAAKTYDLAPLTLIANDELVFTVTNTSGATRLFQVDVFC